jgi:hypothetical protein
MADREFLQRLERDLTDQGKLIEAGWIGLRLAAISPDAGKVQLEECRTAFFAGAQHLFSSIMSIMEEDKEPTETDLRRMGLISDELTGFYKDFAKKHGLPYED